MDLAKYNDTPLRQEDGNRSRIRYIIRQCEARIKFEEELRDGKLQEIKQETRRVLALALKNPNWDPELLRMKLMPQDSEYRWVNRRSWKKIDAYRKNLHEQLKKVEGGELANGPPDGLNTPEDSMVPFGDDEVSPVGIRHGTVEDDVRRARLSNDSDLNDLADGPGPSTVPPLSQGRSLVEVGILPPEQLMSQKRPLQDKATIEVAPVRKRARHDSTRAGAEERYNTATGNPPKELRKITFDEVYQNGEAEYKHAIIQFPPKGRGKKWYIVKCETSEHKVHFAGEKGVLRGATSHLASSLHGLYKSHGNSIEHLGWEVVDCDKRLAELNNRAMDRAIKEGYRPLNTVDCEASSKTKTSSKSAGQRDRPTDGDKGLIAKHDNSRENNNVTVRGKKPSSSIKRSDILPASPITRPEDGGVYYAFWPPDQVFYLVFVLGWDGSPSSGLPEMAGGLSGFGLLDRNKTRIPPCYKIDWKVPRILDWVEGYRDGESQEVTREFPIMFFDTPRNTGGWIEAGYLAHFDPENPIYRSMDSRFVIEPEQVELALTAYARCRGFSSYQQFRDRNPDAHVMADSVSPSPHYCPENRTRSGSSRDQRAVRRSSQRVEVNVVWDGEEDDEASDWAIDNDADGGQKDEDYDDGDKKGVEDGNGSFRRGSPELGEMNPTTPAGPVDDDDGNSSNPDAPARSSRFNSRRRLGRRRVVEETPSLQDENPTENPTENLDDTGDELAHERTAEETDKDRGRYLVEWANGVKPKLPSEPRARGWGSDEQNALARSGARSASRPISPMTAIWAPQPTCDAFMTATAARARAAIRAAKPRATLSSEGEPRTFPLARYSDEVNEWSRGSDNFKIVLRIDEATGTARGALRDGAEFVIDPRHILSQHRIRDRETGYVRLTFVLDEAGSGAGGRKECVLFFADEEEGGKPSSRLAREFWTWAREIRERERDVDSWGNGNP